MVKLRKTAAIPRDCYESVQAGFGLDLVVSNEMA